MEKSTIDILLSGVGGQGTVLASRVLAGAATKAGFSTKTSETIGMAQREGSVTSHVRIGKQVWSPLISPGRADLLVSLELAEAARNISILSKNGIALINDGVVIPVTVSAGLSKYDAGAIRRFLEKNYVGRLKFINSINLAKEAGSEKTVNSVMLGAIIGLGILPMKIEEVLEVLLEMVPKKTVEMNKKAFEFGLMAVA